jgi:hypothetical protein
MAVQPTELVQTKKATLMEQFTVFEGYLQGWLGAIMLPCFLYLASRGVLVWTTGLHWVLGALVSLCFAVAVGFLFLGLNESLFRNYEARVVLSLFASIVLLAASICSAWSYIIMSRGWGSYSSATELYPGAFADFYLWHLIDMIPGFKVWETLGIQPPVKANDPVASLPLLAFRLCFVLPILALFKKWYDIAKGKKES